MEARFVELSEPNDLQKPHNWENPWNSTFCTVFEGDAPIQEIRERLVQIVAANPWLVGRLRMSPESGKPAVWIPPFPDLGDSFVQVCGDGSVDAALNSLDTPVCSHLMPKAGVACLDNDQEPLFILQLVVDVRQRRFLLTSSLSHHVGDGASHYRIYGMLHPSASVEALHIDRVKFVDALRAQKDADTGRKWGLHKTLEPVQLQHDAVPSVFTFYVDHEWIADQKRKRMPVKPSDEVPWLSTNDVLTSWFFSVVKPAVGMIIVDCRGKAYGDAPARKMIMDLQLSDKFVGNYHDAYLFLPSEYAEPANIRRALTRLTEGECAGHPVDPGADEKGGAFITNWAALYQDLQFEGCRQILHFPFQAGGCHPIDPEMVIFKPTASTIACRVACEDSSRLGFAFRDEGAVGEVMDYRSAFRTS